MAKKKTKKEIENIGSSKNKDEFGFIPMSDEEHKRMNEAFRAYAKPLLEASDRAQIRSSRKMGKLRLY